MHKPKPLKMLLFTTALFSIIIIIKNVKIIVA